MSSVIFVVSAFIFMFIGRKLGWALSRTILYPFHVGITALLCLAWGVAVAYSIHSLISWQHPNLVVRIIFGYLLGAYVAVPNYGLVAESSIPPHAMPKHNMIFTLPVFAYLVSSIAFAWLAQSGALAKRDVPQSVQMVFLAIDDLLKADERPDGITAEANLARIKPLMEDVIASGTKANRAELNSLYPGLGDHFLDDAVAHAHFIIQVINTKDSDAMTRAMAAIIRWQKWWNAHQKDVMEVVANRYG